MRIADLEIGKDYATTWGVRVRVQEIVSVPAKVGYRLSTTRTVRQVKVIRVVSDGTLNPYGPQIVSAVKLKESWADYEARQKIRAAAENATQDRAEALRVALRAVGLDIGVSSWQGIEMRLSGEQADALTQVLRQVSRD